MGFVFAWEDDNEQHSNKVFWRKGRSHERVLGFYPSPYFFDVAMCGLVHGGVDQKGVV